MINKIHYSENTADYMVVVGDSELSFSPFLVPTSQIGDKKMSQENLDIVVSANIFDGSSEYAEFVNLYEQIDKNGGVYRVLKASTLFYGEGAGNELFLIMPQLDSLFKDFGRTDRQEMSELREFMRISPIKFAAAIYDFVRCGINRNHLLTRNISISDDTLYTTKCRDQFEAMLFSAMKNDGSDMREYSREGVIYFNTFQDQANPIKEIDTIGMLDETFDEQRFSTDRTADLIEKSSFEAPIRLAVVMQRVCNDCKDYIHRSCWNCPLSALKTPKNRRGSVPEKLAKKMAVHMCFIKTVSYDEKLINIVKYTE